MRSIICTAVCLSLAVVHAKEENKEEKKAAGLPVPFPGLKTFVIEGEEAAMPEQISYDPAIAKLINEKVTPEKDDYDSGAVRVLETRLSRDNETKYVIVFDPGPSADPFFTIADAKDPKKPLGSIGADALIVPGNGFIYAMGRSNNMHLVRQKFEIRDGKVEEVKQPFLYVGLDTKANVPLKLTAQKDGGEVIANIPKGDPLQVVVSDEEYLLIKTQFGLVGWFKMKTDVMSQNAEIEGIYYAGD